MNYRFGRFVKCHNYTYQIFCGKEFECGWGFFRFDMGLIWAKSFYDLSNICLWIYGLIEFVILLMQCVKRKCQGCLWGDISKRVCVILILKFWVALNLFKRNFHIGKVIYELYSIISLSNLLENDLYSFN